MVDEKAITPMTHDSKFTPGPNSGGSQDQPLFQWIVAGSTALAFAALMGSVGCLASAPQGLGFRWRWSALIWMGVGAAVGWGLWRAVWAAARQGTRQTRRRLVTFLFLTAALGLVAFAFPMRYVPAAQFHDAAIGLSCAVVVLTCVGWMIFRLMKAFSQEEEGSQRPRRGQS